MDGNIASSRDEHSTPLAYPTLDQTCHERLHLLHKTQHKHKRKGRQETTPLPKQASMLATRTVNPSTACIRDKNF
jgi:hypothetical protein